MNINDFKYSYNRFYKIYRVKLFEHGKWQKCTYDKKNFEFLINNNLKNNDEIKNFPYKPYLFFIIKWWLMNLWKWIKINDPKIKNIQDSGTLWVLGLLCTIFISNSWINSKENNETTKDEKEMQLKEQTIQNYKVLTDSLLIEIKQKESIIKDFVLAHQKDSILKSKNDSLKTKQ
ncbi:hypothetical protein [Flavobacterium marginilacus]|uniref:hypothetical protein n=1 Tax=Flavobacterium marginilacus TaxID=3003256 RepID=UPI00248DBFB2|nr:hypothetical protein [Flavobacterium marginilacus]